MRNDTQTDRGQAYTLEGFIGAMVVLMAILFALQSVVITPTTGGAADRTVKAQLQQETQDALVVSSTESPENLSYMVRYWDGDGGFEGANETGPGGEQDVYSTDQFEDEFVLGEIVDRRFNSSGQSYNVELHYLNGSDPESQYLVYRGSPSSNAVTASYTVTLFDNQTVTRDGDDRDLEEVPEEDRTIPQYDEDDLVYNVVEVRVVVW